MFILQKKSTKCVKIIQRIREVFTNYIPDKTLMSGIFKKLLQLNNRKKNNLITN